MYLYQFSSVAFNYRVLLFQKMAGIYRRANTLDIGKLYTITFIERVISPFLSKHGEEIIQIFVHFNDNGTHCFCLLPSTFNDVTKEDCEEINNKIGSGQPVQLVYYGNINHKIFLEVVPFGSGK